MNWDKVNREKIYRTNGTQVVAGGDSNPANRSKKKKKKAKRAKGFNAKYPGTCMKCSIDFPAGARIIMFASGKPLHASCL